jgi:5'-methylthioadenosine phosphorylase
MEKEDILGIIGGSGLYHMDGLKNIREVFVATPFGNPSDKLVFGEINGIKLAFLPRHGNGHKILPSEINYAANVYALKASGVKKIISVSAVGSLKKEIKPGDMVVIDQFFDFTKNRKNTFFGNGLVAHVSMAEPVCPSLRKTIIGSCKTLGISHHDGGSYLCIEGPQFSTRAESLFYKNSGFDVIGMTNATEARFAREAEICYATIAMATDYDCWHEEEDNVNADMIIKILLSNAEKAKNIIKTAVNNIAFSNSNDGSSKDACSENGGGHGTGNICSCGSSLRQAVVTAKKDVPEETLKKLSIFNLYD